MVGLKVGSIEGFAVGVAVGYIEGIMDGPNDGEIVVGLALGIMVDGL
jgi:hypothetical protein